MLTKMGRNSTCLQYSQSDVQALGWSCDSCGTISCTAKQFLMILLALAAEVWRAERMYIGTLLRDMMEKSGEMG